MFTNNKRRREVRMGGGELDINLQTPKRKSQRLLELQATPSATNSASSNVFLDSENGEDQKSDYEEEEFAAEDEVKNKPGRVPQYPCIPSEEEMSFKQCWESDIRQELILLRMHMMFMSIKDELRGTHIFRLQSTQQSGKSNASYAVDNDLALKIYIKPRATPKVVTAFTERRKFDKIFIYSKQAQMPSEACI
ncbi:unnamed protein product [Fraxinus pennsylvanica]|uniref:Uncharacterized protein n=1 Tax=Fraxinus pennsylvanica TaxID=56036 RepID=A0AAD2ADU4_9LAMI|nr:unnamed protein product [Fraxinus pennsylvanica]